MKIKIDIEKELDSFIDEELNKHFSFSKLNFLISQHIKDIYLKELKNITSYNDLNRTFKEISNYILSLVSP